ncbi:hypothetical protein AMECASPLE_033955 [Ameca splendens]|uniref:Uncharacterized protein n=1 Tax=Ameca splendens TaxID=208324 RepID=A0ABV0XVT6_9TELE
MHNYGHTNGAFTPNADSSNFSPHLCAVARLTFRMQSAWPNVNKWQRFTTSSNSEELLCAACWFQLNMVDMDFTDNHGVLPVESRTPPMSTSLGSPDSSGTGTVRRVQPPTLGAASG